MPLESGSLPTAGGLPSGAISYHFAIIDAPDVVAANNFISLFNPAASGKNYVFLEAHIGTYAVSNTTNASSMAMYRVSAASGGTLATAIARYDTSKIVSTAEIRTGNPTVTRTTGVPAMPITPAVATGAGGNASTTLQVTPGTNYLLRPGEGRVFGTASGDTNQRWNIDLIWAEY